MADLHLGIDLGTTSIKAGVFDTQGQQIAQFSERHETTRRAPGWAEQDAAGWTRLLDTALDRLATASAGHKITAAGLTSQVNTHVFVNAEGRPLMPAILWQDTRAAAEAAELDAQLTDAQKIEWLGAPIPIDASHPLARMLWVQRHHPDIWAQTRHVVLPKDFALAHLTGQMRTDPVSNIGLVGLDGTYVSEILELVPGAADRMAPLTEITEIMGYGQSGPLRGVPMATTTMDGWVGLIGAGATQNGAGVYLSGTSEILGLVSDTVTNAPGIVVFAKACDLRLHVGPTQSGGASADWLSGLIHMPLPDIAKQVATRPRRPNTPLFLPQLAGERAPLWNPDLRGAFLGMTAGTDAIDLAHAVFEGVALSARHVSDSLRHSAATQPDMLLCGGGGFRADAWGQIRANVLNTPLRRMRVNEPGVVGAACIAAVATHAATTLETAQAPFRQFDTTWEPDPKAAAFYDDLFGIYTQALQTNETLGKGLTALSTRY